MRKRKSLLIYSLVLGGMITTGAASCGNQESSEELGTYTFVLDYDSSLGLVSASSEKGEITEDAVVTIRVNAFAGNHVESIVINGTSQDTSKKEFSVKPMKGENKVTVVFAEDEEVDDPSEPVEPSEDTYSFSLNYDETMGTVSVDKEEGKLESDTKVTITITPFEGYEVQVITINGEDQDITKSSFEITPVKGENTVEVLFVKASEEVQSFTVVVEPTENGTVTVDKTSGNVGETVTLTITPDEGYEVSEILINGESKELNTTSFEPQEGENTVKVTFKESAPVVDTYTITIKPTKNGTVTVDKTMGNVGETVNLTITPNEGYEVSKIWINDVEQSLDTTSFEPKKDENIISVTFSEIPPKFDDGLEFTGLNYDLETDFESADDFYSFILEKVVTYFPDYDEEATKEWFESLDFYNSFAVRYGVKEASLDRNFRYILNSDLINLFTNPKKDNFTLEDCTVVSTFLIDALENLSLEEFAGTIGFLSYAFIANANTNNNPSEIFNYKTYEILSGAQLTVLDSASKSYLNTLLNNSTFDYDDTLTSYLDFVDLLSEFIYRPLKATLANYTYKGFGELIYNALGTLTTLTDQGSNFTVTDDNLIDFAKLLSQLFGDNFYSKESFYQIVDKLNNMKDPIEEFMKIFPNSDDSVYYGGLKEAISLLTQNKETSYYLIRFVGQIAKKLTPTFFANISALKVNINLSSDEKTAGQFVYMAKAFKEALDDCNESGTDVTALLKNSSSFLTSLKELIASGNTNGINDDNLIDTNTLVETLIEASSKNPVNLSDSEVSRYIDAYNKLMESLKPIEKEGYQTYKVSFDKYYKVGEEINLVIKDENGNDITSQVKVEDFTSDKVGYRRAKFIYPDGGISYERYYVTNSGKYVDVPYWKFSLNSSVNYSTLYATSYNDEEAQTKVYFDQFECGEIDTSKSGLKYSWIKDTESEDYYFFKYIVE